MGKGADDHVPVLLEEVLEALAIRPDGRYVDCTFGRGGHSRAILGRLGAEGRLLALDRDPQAVAVARRLAVEDERMIVEQASFVRLAALTTTLGWTGRVHGVLLDLGVSSPQLEQPERGFSFLRDGPLDMRMDPTSGLSAAEWLGRAREKEIETVLKEYGEERFARRIARAIVGARRMAPIRSTGELAAIVARAHPRWERGQHPATRSFQALRIQVNDELGSLEQVLDQSVEVLAPGGRLAVVSFHSLEDRIVKRFIRRGGRREDRAADPGLPLPPEAARLRPVGRKQRPGAAEIGRNPRARSAVLRVAERLAA